MYRMIGMMLQPMTTAFNQANETFASANQTLTKMNEAQNETLKGWRILNIGFFHPNADPTIYAEGDQFIVGQDIHFRNIHLFITSVETNIAGSDQRRARVCRDLNQLFKGPAVEWWIAQLSPTDRQTMRPHPSSVRRSRRSH
jgi:hypothetical protein